MTNTLAQKKKTILTPDYAYKLFQEVYETSIRKGYCTMGYVSIRRDQYSFLRRVCKKVGVPIFSMHDINFTYKNFTFICFVKKSDLTFNRKNIYNLIKVKEKHRALKTVRTTLNTHITQSNFKTIKID